MSSTATPSAAPDAAGSIRPPIFERWRRIDPLLPAAVPWYAAPSCGTPLVDRFHREAEAAGVGVILLHYEQLNPLSAPFWNRHGYRPLWTTWEAVPASIMR